MPTAIEWVRSHIPQQHGRLVLVTGANSGIGFETARLLAQRGAHVVLACRNVERGREALRRVRGHAPDAHLELLELDLSDLQAVARAADEIRSRHDHLDVLINNAGVMATPPRRTPEGFELQLATNHLGHFALTGRLLPALLAGERPRVVTVASNLHRRGRIRFDDLNWRRGYHPVAAYSQSKLANLLFTFELQRRSARAGLPLMALAAHPGWTATALYSRSAQMNSFTDPGSTEHAEGRLRRPGMWPLADRVTRAVNSVLAQDAAHGALPTVAAAALPEAHGGDYWGPTGPMELRGLPGHARPGPNATDAAAAQRLWTLSEQLTGVSFAHLAAS